MSGSGEFDEERIISLFGMDPINATTLNFLLNQPHSGNFSNNVNFSLSHDELTTVEPSLVGQEETFREMGWASCVLVTLFCSIIAGTVAGNTLVIAAVITTRRLRTVTNCFVMSLAVADWLVGVFVMPPKVALYLVHNKWKLGEFFCELWIALDILLCTASILSLCAISIDRYLAITRPLAYSRRRRSKRLALSMISCVWVAAIIITSPPIFGWFDKTENVENKCEYNENTGYVVYSALGSFFLPLLVMLYVYARIACVIARRQNSIQKLSNASDKKTQCCVGSDAEEPLRGQAAVKGTYERGNGNNEQGEIKYNNHQQHHTSSIEAGQPTPSPEQQRQSPGDVKRKRSFWKMFHIRSCVASADDDSHFGNGTKRSSSGGQKSAAGSESDSAAGLALSLPDPATLSGSAEAGNTTDNTLPRSTCSTPRHCGQNASPIQGQQHSHPHQQGQSQHPLSRTRTGSRLCHHSIATTSPQRNIHRVHQTTSSTTRLFLDNELIPLVDSKSLPLSKSTPRVWTVEETTNAALGGCRHKSPNGRAASFKHERNGRNSGRFTNTATSLTVPMNHSPAGNPASLMSSTNVVTAGSAEPSPSHNSAGSTRNFPLNRVYHPQNYNHHGHQHHHPATASSMMHRGRSIKLTLNVHGNDHNQNGNTITREFSSGRVASFKRETKTAQTLAAVVGGFIICWLPFFVAYVIAPFSSDTIPTALMDALIWLGWSNSTINPFIYAFYSPDFRSAFWRLTVRKCVNLVGQRRSAARRSPRRFDEHNNIHSRVSA